MTIGLHRDRVQTMTVALTKTFASTDDEIARELLVKNNWELTPVETLVDLLGFTEVEKRMQKLFWDPAFRSAHIYLSDELIKDHLTDETGECAVRHFIARTLTKCFVKDRDYIEVTKDHELVSAHFNRPPVDGKNPKPPSHRKRHFVITSKCFKSMLMMSSSAKGILTRGYYIKIEDAARIMSLQISLHREHIFELESKANEIKLLESAAQVATSARLAEEAAAREAEAAKRAEEAAAREAAALAAKALAEVQAKESIERKERIIRNIMSFTKHAKMHVKRGFVYIAASSTLANENMFKVGITGLMTKRVTQFNTPIAGVEHKFHIVFYRECYSIWAIEKLLKDALGDYRAKDADEVYCVHYKWLEDIISTAVDAQTPTFEKVNDLTRFGNEHSEEYHSSIFNPVAIMIPEASVARRGRPKAAAHVMLDEQAPAAISTRVAGLLKEYMAAAHGVPNFTFDAPPPAAAASTPIQFSWKRFVAFMKANPTVHFKNVGNIKAAANALLSHLSLVECCWREVKTKINAKK